MRKAFDRQQRMDRPTISNVPLNLGCRDEIIPILAALKHIYAQPKLRDEILRAVARDVNRDSSRKCGRKGMDYWPILVLASVRLGCNFDYDRLHDLAEQHRALRQMMGIGDWDEETSTGGRSATTSRCSAPRPSNASTTRSSPKGTSSCPKQPRPSGRFLRRRNQHPLSHREQSDP